MFSFALGQVYKDNLIYIFRCTKKFEYIYIYIYIHTKFTPEIKKYIHLHSYIYICNYIVICIYICIYKYVYIYIYISMCLYSLRKLNGLFE